MTSLVKTIKYLLLATAVTPLVFFNSFPFPHVFSKIFFFRILVEIALVLFLVYLFWAKDKDLWARLKSFFANKLSLGLLVFFLSLLISTIFAQNQFHAFFGEVARGDGFFNLLHFLVFVIILTSIFDKADWESYLKISLLVGGVVVVFGWLQYWSVKGILGFDGLWFGISVNPGSGGSAIGNPAFLGAYMIFLAGFAFLLFREAKGFWRYFNGGLFLTLIPTFLIANVRGAIFGLVMGGLFFLFYFAFRKVPIVADQKPITADSELLDPARGKLMVADFEKTRKISRWIIIFLAVFGLLFVGTNNATIWQSVPGLNRIATISFEDSSFMTRKIALGVSLDAFKEHPIFGWGLENYITAYNKHYDPAYAVYEEAFFDRAHNKLAEILVIQGLFGLLAYLGIFVLFFYLLFKKVEGVWFQAVLGAIVVAYFVQNLFLFDTPTSYLFFYALLGFLVFEAEKGKFGGNKITGGDNYGKLQFNYYLAGLSLVLIIFVAYSLYNFYLIPFKQAMVFRIAERGEISVADLLEKAPEFLEPYNFIQPTIRFQFLQSTVNSPAVRVPEFGPVADLAAGTMIEVVEREPTYNLRNFALLGQIYNERGKVNPGVLLLGEKYLRQALELGPRRQDTYYLLAFNLAAQGKFEEAIETNNQAVTLDDRVAKSHYNLGISYTLAGREYYILAEEQLDRALEIGFLDPSSLITDFNNISTSFQGMLSAYILDRDQGATIRIAEKIIGLSAETNSSLAQDMELIIDYASRGDWNTLIEAIRANNPDN